MKNITEPPFDQKPHAFPGSEIVRELPDFCQKSTPPVTISHKTSMKSQNKILIFMTLVKKMEWDV